MAKPRKNKRNSPTPPQKARDIPDMAHESRLWPEDFPAPRTLAIAAFCLFVLGVVLVRAADANALLWLKRLTGYLAGMPDPMRLPIDASSWDIAIVTWCFITGVTASVLHPALGLAAIVLLRTWVDSMTFETENTFFIWLILLLAVLCCVRMIMRGEPIRAVALSGLLTAFIAVCLCTTLTSIQFDASFTALMAWLSQLLVFLIVVNSLSGRASRGIVLTALVAALAMQAFYSIVTYYYLLPVLRSIARNPAVLREFFGTDELTPEIADRLNKNRAFGSMLFPNALAAFLVLGIPYTVASTLPAWRSYREARANRSAMRARGSRQQARLLGAVALFLTVWAGVGGMVFWLIQFPLSYHQSLGTRAWYLAGAIPTILPLALGLVAALWLAYHLARHGVRFTLIMARGWGLPVAALLAFVALFLTYSRGAMLALVVAAIVSWLLYRGRVPRRSAALAALVALLVIGSVLSGSISGPPAAAAPSGEGAVPSLVEAGENVSGHELLNPHTLFLRFAYWGVGWRIFLDHPLTGVGLACFGTAYPVYQAIGDPPVREAHTSLQVFSETGIVGGLLFFLFWGVLLFQGARRVLVEEDKTSRLVLTGLFGSLLAFFLHAGIDINFAHAGLSFFAFLMAGLLVAQRGKEDAETEVSSARPRLRLALVAAMLALIVLAFGTSARALSQDLALSRMTFYRIDDRAATEARQRLSTLDFFSRQRNRSDEDPPRTQVLLRHVLDLGIPMERAARMGVLYAPVDGARRGVRRLRAGERAPDDAILDVRKAQMGFRHAIVAARRWLERLEGIDARFPRSVELAITITQGYRALASDIVEEDLAPKRDAALEKCLEWATECVRRSPMNSDLQDQLARAWWLKATIHPEEGIEAGLASVAAAQRATELAPAFADGFAALAYRHEQMAMLYTAEGLAEQAREQEAAAAAASAHARAIWDAGLAATR